MTVPLCYNKEKGQEWVMRAIAPFLFFSFPVSLFVRKIFFFFDFSSVRKMTLREREVVKVQFRFCFHDLAK